LSSSDGTHSTPKLLKSILEKENMDYTGLKFNYVELWKKYFNMAKEKGLAQSDFHIATASHKRKSSS